jgi:hypothetical protein
MLTVPAPKFIDDLSIGRITGDLNVCTLVSGEVSNMQIINLNKQPNPEIAKQVIEKYNNN